MEEAILGVLPRLSRWLRAGHALRCALKPAMGKLCSKGPLKPNQGTLACYIQRVQILRIRSPYIMILDGHPRGQKCRVLNKSPFIVKIFLISITQMVDPRGHGVPYFGLPVARRNFWHTNLHSSKPLQPFQGLGTLIFRALRERRFASTAI